MKIGVVGFGNRIAHVFFELNKINSEAKIDTVMLDITNLEAVEDFEKYWEKNTYN